jgi:hypothetical protein
MKAARQRIAVYGDMHCGHINAIAAPKDQQSEDSQGCWKTFLKFNKLHGPFDAVLLMGDLIEGAGGKNRGVELTTTDQSKQADMAIRVLDEVPLKAGAKWYAAAGTPYHGGIAEDFERIVASSLKAEYGAVMWAKVGGCLFRMRHKIGRAMNNLTKQIDIHAQRVGGGREPLADALLFGHLHYFGTRSESIAGKTIVAINCPALQGQTDFGSRQCDGDVDIGCVAIDVEGGKITGIHPHIVELGVDTWQSAKRNNRC